MEGIGVLKWKSPESGSCRFFHALKMRAIDFLYKITPDDFDENGVFVSKVYDVEIKVVTELFNHPVICFLDEDLDLLLDKTSKNDSTGNETNWQNRCEILRKLNSELEAKRVMLSQIRLQLQLRITEVEDAKKSAQTSGSRIHHGGVTKPTSL
jgi:hypothetical protein